MATSNPDKAAIAALDEREWDMAHSIDGFFDTGEAEPVRPLKPEEHSFFNKIFALFVPEPNS